MERVAQSNNSFNRSVAMPRLIGKDQPSRIRRVQNVLKWLALGAAALNPIVNDAKASYLLKIWSSPPPHPSEPFISRYGGVVLLLTLVLGLASLPRWQGIVALIVLPACLFLWGSGL